MVTWCKPVDLGYHVLTESGGADSVMQPGDLCRLSMDLEDH